jgi:hypothetical protein
LRPLVYNILLAFLLAAPVHPQLSRRYEPPIATPLRIVSLPDSLIRIFNEDSLIAKTISNPDTVLRRGKSTTVALLASLVVPGTGQIYNGAYWKAPIVWGVGYYFVSVYKQQNDLYQTYRKQYSASIDSLPGTGIPKLKEYRDFYRNQRDTFGWYVAITYIITLLDAYVDASLFNFEVSPNLQPASELRASVRVPF